MSMVGFGLFTLFLTRFVDLPPASSSSSSSSNPTPIKESIFAASLSSDSRPDPFEDLLGAFKRWDSEVGCARFREKHRGVLMRNGSSSSVSSGSLQDVDEGELDCGVLGMNHVSVLVKGWTWIPDNMDNLYSCRCGLSCLWTKLPIMADNPDALFFESSTPPLKRRKGDPLRVYMDLEPGRKRSGYEDVFISYHAKDDVQSTYAGSLFHKDRNYHLSPSKRNVSIHTLFLFIRK
ncbi:unnamed protein product [Cuscuta campestris]|uniref:Uncharacterized protein n=1 Tax=Cuscuta campestris TaxID=132261 RepID=A0A484MRA1_9ASTE|nr:unnamed protein product [Cuscuta campestris]